MDDRELGAAVRGLTLAWVHWHEATDRRERATDLRERVDGSRVVDGGQVDSDGRWVVTDAESGETLAEGTGYDTYEAAWKPEWIHRDVLSQQAFENVEQPTSSFGLPPRLAEVLVEWAVDSRDEAIAFLTE
jgi:hypothetical protein